MIEPKATKQTQPKIVVGPKSSPGGAARPPDPVPSQDMIRARAYELFEKGGREPGRDEQDWLCAEQEILGLPK